MVRTLGRTIVAGAVAMTILGGCMGSFMAIRRDMMATSLLYCTSQYYAKIGEGFGLKVGLSDRTLALSSDIQQYWNGIVSDPEFREFLKEEGISVIEFQARVSRCQREWLERDGYFDIIRSG